MPPYPGVAQVMEVNKGARGQTATPSTAEASNGDWEAEYGAYCAAKEKELDEKEEAAKEQHRVNENDNVEASDWALQYHNYCVEKEAKLAEMVEEKANEKAIASTNGADWEVEYAKHLAEKAAKEE